VCLFDRNAAALGVPARKKFAPEAVVESEIEQSAVHVEKDGVDRLPVGRMGASLHAPMI